MGIIFKEEYVCDYCGDAIIGGEVLVAKLGLRRYGARGLGREFALAFHDACSAKLIEHAAPVTRQRRAARTSA